MKHLRATTTYPARILSVAGYRPSVVLTNEELCQTLDSNDEWIKAHSGIESRRLADKNESLSYMSTQAGRLALEKAGLGGFDIDCVILATVTHLTQFPALATEIADNLACTPAAAFDLSAGCTGFMYGLTLAHDLVHSGTARNVLVIGAERLSDLLDMTDRSTAFIFADGAGAVVVGRGETQGLGPTVWGSDGSRGNLIDLTRNWGEFMESPEDGRPRIHMEGPPVFKWAAFSMVTVAKQALAAADVTVDQLDAFIPHQANLRIVNALTKGLRLPDKVVVSDDIINQGNTSSASIPLAMAQLLEDGKAKSGDLALLLGFGSGLTYGGVVVELP